MIFSILIGASIFSLIFRGVGGDLFDQIFEMMPGGKYTAFIIYSAGHLPLWFYLRFYRNLLCHYSLGGTATLNDGF